MIYKAMRLPTRGHYQDAVDGSMTASQVLVTEDAATWTGLYDHNATPIYRFPEKVGFVARRND